MSNYASGYLKAISCAALICGSLAFAGPGFAAGTGVGANGNGNNGNSDGSTGGAAASASGAGNNGNTSATSTSGSQAADSGASGKSKGAIDNKRTMCKNVMAEPDSYEDFIVTSCRNRGG